MAFSTIVYEKNAPVATVTLNRPDELNALSETLQYEVREAFQDAGWQDDAIRVIVLKAAGRAFSAGFDISARERGG
jgi:enoyl-CoA hydratase